MLDATIRAGMRPSPAMVDRAEAAVAPAFGLDDRHTLTIDRLRPAAYRVLVEWARRQRTS